MKSLLSVALLALSMQEGIQFDACRQSRTSCRHSYFHLRETAGEAILQPEPEIRRQPGRLFLPELRFQNLVGYRIQDEEKQQG